MLAAVAVVAGLLVPTAGPASAHDRLVDSTPSTGQHLDSAPAEIRLTFSADVMDVGAAVRVIDAADADWSAGDPVLAGSVVTVPVDPAMPDGEYRAAWRVVSSDGHAISGVVPFTVGEVAGESAGVTPVPGAGAGETGSAAPDAASGTATSGAGTDIAARDDSGSPGRTALVAAAGAAVALGLYLLVLRLRRR